MLNAVDGSQIIKAKALYDRRSANCQIINLTPRTASHSPNKIIISRRKANVEREADSANCCATTVESQGISSVIARSLSGSSIKHAV